jgi:lipoyl-dependent peroxiredoxin
MAIRSATAVWKGSLTEGAGTLSSESGALREAAYSFPSRFQEGEGTNPEELIAAAHAGCFSMALSHGLAQAGHAPTRVSTEARVHLEKGDEGFSITLIELICEAVVPGIDDAAFQEQAEGAKKGCPVSRALSAIPIELKATLAT